MTKSLTVYMRSLDSAAHRAHSERSACNAAAPLSSPRLGSIKRGATGSLGLFLRDRWWVAALKPPDGLGSVVFGGTDAATARAVELVMRSRPQRRHRPRARHDADHMLDRLLRNVETGRFERS